MIENSLLKYAVDRCGTAPEPTGRVIEMLDEEMTVPFIARYRKERTGGMDEVSLEKIHDAVMFARELNQRRQTVLKTIADQGKLTDELKAKIESTWSRTELEDLYLPYKPKRRTRATMAREKGLEPLAEALLSVENEESPEILAAGFVDVEKDVHSLEEALKGAGDILAEKYSENPDLRRGVREHVWKNGALKVTVTDDYAEKRTKFEQYYDYSEPVRTLPSHRVLAIRRGEKEEVLRSKVQVNTDEVLTVSRDRHLSEEHPRVAFLSAVLKDALKRLVLPSVETDIQMELKQQADEDAIQVFAANLGELLLAPPAGGVRVLGVDPGFRTGCKLVVIDETGKLLEHTVIFPTAPRKAVDNATRVALKLISEHRVAFVVIGNGTASRETRAFFAGIVPDGVTVTVVNESGASVYSASEAGREEFPDHDVTVRGAVSIARRFQDPLSELVKIEPRSIGVGQYQHDVSQARLKQRLDMVVASAVNRVGVDLNTASAHLLKYVSGIGSTLARNIVRYRDESGAFRNRGELTRVRMFGERAFQQSSGFLRIREGDNPLDATAIHPEAYDLAAAICTTAGKEIKDVIGHTGVLETVDPGVFVTDAFGLPTIQDVMRELEAPGRDPRKSFSLFEFAEGVEEITDLEEGMALPGVVTNVTRFGAFVDIGVHQDGLVHVSELAHEFIQRPETVVAVGQTVRVKVLSVDVELKRIQLSIKALLEKPVRPPRRKKKTPRRGRTPSAGEKKGNSGPDREDPLASLKRKWGAK